MDRTEQCSPIHRPQFHKSPNYSRFKKKQKQKQMTNKNATKNIHCNSMPIANHLIELLFIQVDFTCLFSTSVHSNTYLVRYLHIYTAFTFSEKKTKQNRAK